MICLAEQQRAIIATDVRVTVMRSASGCLVPCVWLLQEDGPPLRAQFWNLEQLARFQASLQEAREYAWFEQGVKEVVLQ